MELPAVLTRHRRAMDEYLRSIVSNEHPPALYGMIRYHLGWEDVDGRPVEQAGKGLRAGLCLLTCEAAGGDWRRAVPAAAAVELVHNFSLVHDDIQDRDRMRRSRATVWSIWGEAQAINAGDALLALAHLAILHLPEKGVPDAIALEAACLLNERTLEMVEGQTLDLGFEGSLKIDVASYLEMIEKKTGALFDCSLRLGALVGVGDRALAEALGDCGRLLGAAFQIRDDMLGVWGAENRTGKQPAADIRRRKKSLPVIYALSHADGPTHEQLRRVYSGRELSDEDVSLVLRCLDAVGAQAHCARVVEERADAALAKLDSLRLNSDAAAELRQAAEFLLQRDF